MESQRLVSLASVGLALRAASPPLLHAIRGRLHDITMLTALLQSTGELDSVTVKHAQRLDTLAASLKLLERNVDLLAAIAQESGRDGDVICATSAVLPDVSRLLQDEAARQRARFAFDVEQLPSHVRARARGVECALLACGAWMAQRAGAGGALRIVGREDHGDALFEFDAPLLDVEPETATHEDLRLLATLVEASGGRLAAAPKLRIWFARAAE